MTTDGYRPNVSTRILAAFVAILAIAAIGWIAYRTLTGQSVSLHPAPVPVAAVTALCTTDADCAAFEDYRDALAHGLRFVRDAGDPLRTPLLDTIDDGGTIVWCESRVLIETPDGRLACEQVTASA